MFKEKVDQGVLSIRMQRNPQRENLSCSCHRAMKSNCFFILLHTFVCDTSNKNKCLWQSTGEILLSFLVS